jgi:hypothetical protein
LVFFPEHFNTPPVKDLIAAEVDPITRVIYHKQGPVAIQAKPKAAVPVGGNGPGGPA